MDDLPEITKAGGAENLLKTPTKSTGSEKIYMPNTIGWRILLGFGFLIILYMLFNPGVWSSEAIGYSIGSIFIFVIYPANMIFRLSSLKIVVSGDYIKVIDRKGEDTGLKFADISRITYSTGYLIGSRDITLHAHETSGRVEICFDNFSADDENMVAGAILSHLPGDVLSEHCTYYRSLPASKSYSFSGSTAMAPEECEHIQRRLADLEASDERARHNTLDQIESEICASRRGEVNELYMPAKTRQIDP